LIFLIKVQKMRRIITCLVLLVLVIRVEVSAQLFVDWGSQWSYFKGISEPSQPIDLWRTAGFNATGWAVGNAPFRYGDGTGGTLLTDMLGKYTTFYIRKEIFVETLDNIDELRIDVDYDDGFVLWINGVQILQSNVPSNYAYTQGAINSHESGEFERYTLRKEQLPLAEGANLIAVQGFNLSKSSSDFYLDLKMEGVKWLPETTGVNCDRPSGFYTTPFVAKISSLFGGETVKYTLDGSDPRSSATAIEAFSPVSVTIDPATTLGGRAKTGVVILRASKFEEGFDPSKPVTRSYIFIDRVKEVTAHPGGNWPASGVNGQVIDLPMDAKIINDSRYASLIDDALLDLPSLSLVVDPGDLFNPNYGIYVNASYHGRSWERFANVELINPDGSPGFNINAGLRIRGGWSRHDEFAKHAFRLFFRSEYGERKLRFPLFGDEGVNEFDKVDLRCSQNYSWSKGGEEAPYCTMNRDVFSRDCQRDMLQPYTRSRYYHLYLNGLYWGIYQTQERAEESFAESYFGGDEEDYDVIKVNIGDDFNNFGIEATNGNTDAWQRIWEMCLQGFAVNANYYKLIGSNSFGEADTSLTVWVDIDNLIDYMLIIFYTGNFDAPVSKFSSNYNPNNFYAIYNRNQKREGFKFLQHDSEHTLLTDPVGPGVGINENRVNIGRVSPTMNVTSFQRFHPQWLHFKLSQNVEYRIRFADRVYRHFFNSGVFHPDSCVRRFRKTSDQLELAIIAESARWGDQGSWPARTKDDDWLPAVNQVVYEYIPFRSAIVLKQLQDEQLYGSLQPPVFTNSGSVIEQYRLTIAGDYTLLMENPNQTGSIIYTTDGKDPRAVGGAESNTSLNGGRSKELVIHPGQKLKARIKYGAVWSALHEVHFQDESLFSNLKITELHYHPLDQGNYPGTELEFIELKNTGNTTLDLSGIAFTEGIRYTFPEGTLLPPQSFIVLASNGEAFRNFYGFSPFGTYLGNLSNSGEKITLMTGDKERIISFTYSDTPPWPEKADGDGFSLVSVERNPQGNPGYPEYWTTSGNTHGSPAADDIISSVLPSAISSGKSLMMTLYPNPAKTSVTIQLSVPRGENADVRLYDMNGRIIQSLASQYFPAGEHQKTIPLENLTLSPGLYILTCQSASSSTSRKLMIAP